ncbi:sugar ABC transporter ATP-binding protein [uncultured Pseudoteredinibacter sp.]|uniref:sugar ABC transporter ATP-binding protein n=1 Tax=uncultured Pseudoteredinibacter sp. TaxID=1641701 RepID=UPI00260B1BD9|nr:sugar ABC transporter ATP-binding protein [uncultured Pseudoteredinibacter sp.]
MSARLRLENIEKSFAKQKVLEGVSLQLEAGQVLALMGENGAGKSTLMNISCGVYQEYQGQIYIDDSPHTFDSPKSAETAGVIMVHQELNLLPELSVAENIFLGNEEKNKLGLIQHASMANKAQSVLDQLGLNLPASTAVKELNIGQQQLVEIARALLRDAKILVLDEPSAALSDQETQHLFTILRRLTKEGVSIIYISHRLDELSQIADQLAVLRNGSLVAKGPMQGYSANEVIKLMIGEELADVPRRSKKCADNPSLKLLEIKDLNGHWGKRTLKGINFDVKEGEILGLTGLLGSGCGELLECLFGLRDFNSEGLVFDGQTITTSSPRDAIAQGLAYISDDRKHDSLVLNRNLLFNLGLPTLAQQNSLLIADDTEKQSELLQQWTVKYQSTEQSAGSLSGGNQQKLVIARWLALKPKLVLMNEPTRGVDVAAKAEIYRLLEALKQSGMSFIVASTDLPELCRLCDRVLVLHEGSIAQHFKQRPFSQNKILSAAQGHYDRQNHHSGNHHLEETFK